MRHLNYSHLLYFWTVAREGSITRAAEVLHLTPQTISGQLKLLEATVGEPLFERAGRGLVLTTAGQIVHRYAEQIFAIGSELTLRVRAGLRGPTILRIGLVNSIPKLIAYRILQPVLSGEDPIRIACHEGDLDALLGDLAVHRIDVVLSDRPLPVGLNLKAYNHPIGDSPVAFFARNALADRYRRGFPQSLAGAPLLLPLSATGLRHALDDWFEARAIAPRVMAEFDDSALLKVFGEAGVGVFPAPLAIADQIASMYHAVPIGVAEGVREHYFAISPERKLKHPAVVRITEAVRERLFNDDR